MTSAWNWLPLNTVFAIHAEQIDTFGGGHGLRDLGMLETSLARSLNKATYGDPDVFDLAAAYAYALVSNHPYVDGNKRVGLVAAAVFLGINGYELDAQEADAAVMFLSLAAGEIEEDVLAHWFRDNCIVVG